VTSPPAFAKALEDAKAEIGAVEARRARVTVTVTGADAPRVTLNDAPVRVEALGVPRYVNPGHVVVTASADGFQTATRAVDVGEGKEQSVSIALVKADATPAAVMPPASAPSTPTNGPTGSPSSGSVLRPVAIGAFALGGAGLVMGAVTGGLALGKQSTLKSECPGGVCSTATAQSDASGYHTMETLSTVGFIVGGVGLGGGLVLLLLAPKSEAKTPPAAPTAVTVQPYLGFGSVGATGTF